LHDVLNKADVYGTFENLATHLTSSDGHCFSSHRIAYGFNQ